MQMSEQRENAGVLTRSLEEENSRADSTDFPHDLEEITTFVTKVAWPSIWFRQPIPEQLFLSEMTSSHLCAKELVLHLSRYHILSNLGRTYEGSTSKRLFIPQWERRGHLIHDKGGKSRQWGKTVSSKNGVRNAGELHAKEQNWISALHHAQKSTWNGLKTWNHHTPERKHRQ